VTDPGFEAARSAFQQGLQAQQDGRWADAEAHYRRSLQHLPGRPSTLTNLGAVLLALQRPADALAPLAQALAAEPGNADAWFQQGNALAQLNRLDDALASVERCLAIAPGAGAAWSRRGGLLKDLGRPREAVAALERAIALGADVDVNRYLLASLTGTGTPPRPPRGYVQALFDGYAPDFDEHLVERLQYHVPEQLLHALPRAGFESALDLGCGTGIAGRLLRPAVRTLAGVDLSAGMLAQARRHGVYDTLWQADVVEHLQTTAERHDLVVSADVFIYLGDLDAVFAGVRRVLQPGGVFAFSVEAADEAVDFELRPSSRYAQSARYLRRLAAAHGLQVLTLRRDTLRLDQRQPVEGWLAVMGAP
jgi:predicted TPR repeat methyltransferase